MGKLEKAERHILEGRRLADKLRTELERQLAEREAELEGKEVRCVVLRRLIGRLEAVLWCAEWERLRLGVRSQDEDS